MAGVPLTAILGLRQIRPFELEPHSSSEVARILSMYFRPQAKTYSVDEWLLIRFGELVVHNLALLMVATSFNDRANDKETMRAYHMKYDFHLAAQYLGPWVDSVTVQCRIQGSCKTCAPLAI